MPIHIGVEHSTAMRPIHHTGLIVVISKVKFESVRMNTCAKSCVAHLLYYVNDSGMLRDSKHTHSELVSSGALWHLLQLLVSFMYRVYCVGSSANVAQEE